MTEITSRKNPLVLHAVSLRQKKCRDAEGLFFTEGTKIFTEALSAGFLPERIFLTEAFRTRAKELVLDPEKCIIVTPEVYEKISDEASPEGIFAIFRKRKLEASDKKHSVLLTEGVQDPGNLGTLIRCAVAFGMGEVLTVRSADPFGPKAVRATMGAIFKIPVTEFSSIDEAVAYARGVSSSVIASTLSPDSITIGGASTSLATIMIGSEGQGLSERAIELSDERVIIPIENIESLNASVAGAIFMYDSMCKRRKI